MRLLLVALAAAVVPSAFAADSATRTSFADGSWVGVGRLHQVIQGTTLNANSTFTMRVRGGKVTGTLSVIGAANGALSGVEVTAEMNGRFPLSGTARAPVGRGMLRFTAVAEGKRQSGSGPIVITLSGLRGTCDRMAGRLIFGAGGKSSAANTLSSPFSATRARGSGPAC